MIYAASEYLISFSYTFYKWTIFPQLKQSSLIAGKFFHPLSPLGCNIVSCRLYAIPGEISSVSLPLGYVLSSDHTTLNAVKGG